MNPLHKLKSRYNIEISQAQDLIVIETHLDASDNGKPIPFIGHVHSSFLLTSTW